MFDQLIQFALKNNASDIVMKSGLPPALRIYGDLRMVDSEPLTDQDIVKFLLTILPEEKLRQFRETMELDASVSLEGEARLRVNVLQQRKRISAVLRLIQWNVPTLNELHLPNIVRDLAMRDRGLVLVTGPAGCGKTSTVASMMNYRAEQDSCHIISIEDPIEFLVPSRKALVDQRELGRDTHSFSAALRHALRQDPDMIVVGEMRDLETIQMAITAAETGHLVLSTLHTVDSVRTIDRIIDVFPTFQQRQVRLQLSANILAVVSQTLLKSARGDGLILACEIMVATPAIQNLIRESKTYMISSILQTRGAESMQTINRALADLVQKKLVTFEDAAAKSPDSDDLEKLLGRRGSIMDSISNQPSGRKA